jgi:hypothetical protein
MSIQYKYFDKFLDKVKYSTSFDEVICLYNIFKKSVTDENELKLIKSLLDKKFFAKKIQVDKFCLFLRNIDLIHHNNNYNNDITELIEDMKKSTDDIVQLNIIDKMVSLKNKNNNYNNENFNIIKNKIKKKCPHCDNLTTEYDTTTYTICGYSASGYDWKGCGYDWCFQCGKKLCKCWQLDQLFNKLNRFHDKRCCKSHAHKNGCNNYLDDYCQCNNMYVYRK